MLSGLAPRVAGRVVQVLRSGGASGSGGLGVGGVAGVVALMGSMATLEGHPDDSAAKPAAALTGALAACDAAPSPQVYSWGWGQYGQLGHGVEVDTSTPAPIAALAASTATHVAASGVSNTTAVVTSDGSVFTFGCGKDGRLGHSEAVLDAPNEDVPRRVQGVKDIVNVGVGEYHMVAVTKDGKVWAWGKNRAGQLGLGHAKDVSGNPKAVDTLHRETVVKAVCGRQHSAVLTKDGAVFTWGFEKYGALGRPARGAEAFVPAEVPGLKAHTIVDISAGRDYTLALASSGEVFAFGMDTNGQLGQGGGARYQRMPVLVRGLPAKVVAISAGEQHAVAVTEDGKVYTWGCGSHGQLGHGEKTDSGVPRLVNGLAKKITSAVAGGGHTALVDEDGELWMFGRNRNGQLGRGNHLESIATYRVEPREVDYLSGLGLKVGKVALGKDHSACIAE